MSWIPKVGERVKVVKNTSCGVREDDSGQLEPGDIITVIVVDDINDEVLYHVRLNNSPWKEDIFVQVLGFDEIQSIGE